jgi:hypothetical protein
MPGLRQMGRDVLCRRHKQDVGSDDRFTTGERFGIGGPDGVAPTRRLTGTHRSRGAEMIRHETEATAAAPTVLCSDLPAGVSLVPDNLVAFALRFLSARAATRTLDLQYYRWTEDVTGRLLVNEVLRAADRGIRVRLLLDGRWRHYRSILGPPADLAGSGRRSYARTP